MRRRSWRVFGYIRVENGVLSICLLTNIQLRLGLAVMLSGIKVWLLASGGVNGNKTHPLVVGIKGKEAGKVVLRTFGFSVPSCARAKAALPTIGPAAVASGDESQ